MKLFTRWLTALCVVTASFAQSTPKVPADDATPSAAALNQIQALANAREKSRTAYFSAARDAIEGVVQHPGASGNYVIECIRKVRFAEDAAEFAKWKKKNADLSSSQPFERAANLHLRYLALTLKRATLDSAGPVQPEVWDYLKRLAQSLDLESDDPEQRGTPGKRDKQRARLNRHSDLYKKKRDEISLGWPSDTS